MSLTLETLQDFFKRYGWECQQSETAPLILSGYADSEERTFAVVVSLDEDYIVFFLPYVSLPSDVAQRVRILVKLARLNFSWPIAKLSIDDDNTIIISAEFMTAEFGYSHFETGIELLVEGVQQLIKEIPDLTPLPGRGVNSDA